MRRSVRAAVYAGLALLLLILLLKQTTFHEVKGLLRGFTIGRPENDLFFAPLGTREAVFRYSLPLVARPSRIIAVLTLVWLKLSFLAERLHLDNLIAPIMRPLEGYRMDVSRWWEKDEV